MEAGYFPRGGAKDTPVIQYKKFVFERNKNSIKKNKSRKTFKHQKKKLHDNKKEHTKSRVEKTVHYHLTPAHVGPGFQCLCAVYSIQKDRLIVNMPYNMKAFIHATSISRNFLKLINSSNQYDLSKMFFVGQQLSCKLIETSPLFWRSSDTIKFYATIDPKVINANVTASLLTEGSMFQMSIASEEDRGYTLESGITGAIAFLPFSQAEKYTDKYFGHKMKLTVGTPLWCFVENSTVNPSGSAVVRVKIDENDNLDVVCLESSNLLWPGCKIQTTITEVFKDSCCQVSVDGSSISGTVVRQLDFGADPSEEYSIGSKVEATLVALSPFSHSYDFSFSHRPHRPQFGFSLQKQTVLIGTVVFINDHYIQLKLIDEEFEGVVTMKSLREPSNSEGADEETTAIEYKIGDTLKLKKRYTDYLCKKHLCIVIRKIDSDELENEINQLERWKQKKIHKCKQNGDSASIEIKKEIISDDDSGIDKSVNTNKKKRKKKKKSKVKEETDDGIEIGSDDKGEGEENCDFIAFNKISESNTDSKLLDTNYEKTHDFATNSENNTSSKSKKKKMKKIESEVGDSYKSDLSAFDKKSSYDDDESVERTSKRKRATETSVANIKKIKSESDDELPKLSESIKKKVEDAASHLSVEKVDSCFIWDATPNDLAKATTKEVEEFNEESDEDNSTEKKPLSRKQKKANEEEKERKIREKEEELLKAFEDPKSADHYERLILSRPDDSKIWIKYMAFHLEATEIEKARAVGNRALKLISHRNEQDRLNVWFAMLNLEHLYGTKDLFKETWIEALKCNDDYKVNCKVLDMFVESQNVFEINGLVHKMVKQYRDNVECWYTCMSAFMFAKMEEKARELLQRSLKSLVPKNHVSLISRFALLENSCGHSEEAQALFDNLLTSYPARVDIWFVYLDMLTKSNQLDLARQVFERATALKLVAKKMKSLYKKWLEFEERFGDEESVEMVRKSAIEYVEEATKRVGL